MKLEITWEALEAFLSIEAKQSEGSMPSHKSRFKILKGWFFDSNLDFNRENFNKFIFEKKKLGSKPSYLNGFIKLIKHLGKALKISDFEDYTFFDEQLSPPEDTLSEEEITKLAEIKIKYPTKRFAKEKKLKIPVLIYFLGHIGSRIEETLNLEWRDLSSNPRPMVHFRAEITKTKKERYCAIPRWLYQKLMLFPKESNFIFDKIDKTRFNQELKVRASLANIKKNIHAHLFRDSSINNKLFFGVPLEQVTAYHGHKTTTTTYKYYVRIQAANLAQTLEAFDPAFKLDQTYESMISGIKTDMEKKYNPRVSSYSIETKLNESSKRETSIKFTEK